MTIDLQHSALIGNSSFDLMDITESSWMGCVVINAFFLIVMIAVNPLMLSAAFCDNNPDSIQTPMFANFICSGAVMGLLCVSVNVLQLIFPAHFIASGTCYILLGMLTFSGSLLVFNNFIFSLHNFVYIVFPYTSARILTKRAQIAVIVLFWGLTLVISLTLSIMSYLQGSRDSVGFCFMSNLPTGASYVLLCGMLTPVMIMTGYFDFRVIQTARHHVVHIMKANGPTFRRPNRKYMKRIFIYEYMLVVAYIPMVTTLFLSAHCPTCLSTGMDIAIRTFSFGMIGMVPVFYVVSSPAGRDNL